MPELRIRIEGLQDIVGKLSQDWPEVFSDAAYSAAKATIEPAVKEYPAENRLAMAPFWTDKQRGWFFLFGIKGNFPYARSMMESESWFTGTSGSLQITVSNALWYGIYDQDPIDMSAYHIQQGWTDFVATADRVFPDFQEILAQIIQARL